VEIRVVQKGSFTIGWYGDFCFTGNFGNDYRALMKQFETVNGYQVKSIMEMGAYDACIEFANDFPIVRLKTMSAMRALETHLHYDQRPAMGYDGIAKDMADSTQEFVRRRDEAKKAPSKVEDKDKSQGKDKLISFTVNQWNGPQLFQMQMNGRTTVDELKKLISMKIGRNDPWCRRNDPWQNHFLLFPLGKMAMVGCDLSGGAHHEMAGNFTLDSFSGLEGSFLRLVTVPARTRPKFPPTFNVGDVLLVDDTYGKVCRTIILDTNAEKDQVFIRYTEWSAMWNEWIRIDDKRIQLKEVPANGDVRPDM
jgi:hypothetical protein